MNEAWRDEGSLCSKYIYDLGPIVFAAWLGKLVVAYSRRIGPRSLFIFCKKARLRLDLLIKVRKEKGFTWIK